MTTWRVSATVACLVMIFQLRGGTTTASPHVKDRQVSPAVMLWAWEEPEDLRTLDVHQAGVAFLAGRIFLPGTPQFVPRHQPIRVPENIYAEAVVRIETRPGFHDTDALRAQTAARLLQVADLPRIHGVQVDFDATQSQRAFYSDVLRRTRAGLPAGESLTITALVSWCTAQRSWINTVPIDGAVPMYFRLGQHTGYWPTRNPVCSASRGISTDEPGTQSPTAASRTYLFAPHPWTATQLAIINQGRDNSRLLGGTP